MNDFARVLKILKSGEIEFIVVGGVAAATHGAARATYDVDVVYRRTEANMARIVAALAPYSPYLRGAPKGLPFVWDLRTLEMGRNFTLVTDLGDIDLLGEIGGERYEALLNNSDLIPVLGEPCYCLKLEKLISVKRAAGRTKDLEAIAELEALLEERDNLNRPHDTR
jgi:predicted nucleotidyltransferase